MNQILRIRLEVIDNSVLFQVLDQDERIPRGTRRAFPATNHWSIISEEFPAIIGNNVYLRGTDIDRDYRPILYYTDSKQEAVDTKQEILDALEEYCRTFSNAPIPNGQNMYSFNTNFFTEEKA